MNRLPMWLADWAALWRDLPRHPRQVLLNRAHLRGGAMVLTGAMAADLAIGRPWTTYTVYVLLALLGPSSLVAAAGAVAHSLWSRDLIWPDLVCEFCDGGDPGDDGDDDPQPDGPGDDSDLIREITDYLHTHAPTTANV
jgi:hypothetical protein